MINVVKAPGMMTTKEFASILGIKVYKVRYWDETGKLKAAVKTDGGFRYYSKEQVADALILMNKTGNKGE